MVNLWVYSTTSWYWAATEPVDPTSGNWGEILATYGLAAPFILFLLWVIRELRKDVATKDAKIDELVEALTDKVTPIVTESNSVLNQAMELIKGSRDTSHAVIKAGEVMEDVLEVVRELLRELRRHPTTRE